MDVEKIRQDFPILQQKVNGKAPVYFDNACMSLKPRQVVDAMNDYYYKFTGCVGRSNHSFGRMATEKCEEARKTMARFISAKKREEFVFTRNTTEGINLIAYSLGLGKGDTVLTTDREHNSNLIPWQLLAKRKGINHMVLKSREDMTFDMEGFEKALSEGVRLVSMVMSSNLDGYSLPAKEIVKTAHKKGALVMLDGAQAVPHKKVDMQSLDVDFFAFSGHKMLGPTGTGGLYGKYKLLENLEPFIVGGDTVEGSTYTDHKFLKPPEKFEAGLQDYAGIIGMAEAARYLMKIGQDNVAKHEISLNRIITEGISDINGIRIIGPQDPAQRSGIVSFIINGMDYHEIALLLDHQYAIMTRSGQHCVHSWFNAHGIKGSTRASLYLYNTEEETAYFAKSLKSVAKLK